MTYWLTCPAHHWWQALQLPSSCPICHAPGEVLNARVTFHERRDHP